MMKPLLLAGLLAGLALPALAQPITAPPTGTPGRDAVIETDSNNTGGDRDRVISRGATGATTVDSNSAAAGNAEQPSRAVPQGSGGGGQ